MNGCWLRDAHDFDAHHVRIGGAAADDDWVSVYVGDGGGVDIIASSQIQYLIYPMHYWLPFW